MKPEDLSNYVVPTPSLCEPINGQPVQTQLSAPESGDEGDPENKSSVEKNTDFVAPEEDGNIFGMLDQFVTAMKSFSSSFKIKIDKLSHDIF